MVRSLDKWSQTYIQPTTSLLFWKLWTLISQTDMLNRDQLSSNTTSSEPVRTAESWTAMRGDVL